MMPEGANTEEFAGLFSVGAETLVRNAFRLGLTWRLRPGTVVDVSTANLVVVRLDGDTTPIPVTSMIGSRAINTRVYVLTVPPAGNYMIGQVDAFTPEPTPTRIGTGVETADSATFTAETVIGTVTGDLVLGRTYLLRANAQLGSTVINDTVLTRIREDNIAGTLIYANTGQVYTTANVPVLVMNETHFTAVATGSKTFVVTAQRLTGTGNIRREATPDPGWPQYFYIDYVSG